jgi:hypothetical protein
MKSSKTNDQRVKHGQREHKLYNTWLAMMGGCYRETSSMYLKLGAKGATVDIRWHDINNFIEDVGVKKEGMWFTRIDETKPYGQNNWQWASRSEILKKAQKNIIRDPVKIGDPKPRPILDNKHTGRCNNPLYNVWRNIMSGCYNKNVPGYKYSGALGVTVDERWHDPHKFFDDVGIKKEKMCFTRKDKTKPLIFYKIDNSFVW